MKSDKKGVGIFPLFFALVMLLFCGILVYAYFESKAANPIMLDESGHVKAN